jgi:hypothetical protein
MGRNFPRGSRLRRCVSRTSYEYEEPLILTVGLLSTNEYPLSRVESSIEQASQAFHIVADLTITDKSLISA